MKRAKKRDRVALMLRNQLPAIVARALTRAVDDVFARVLAEVLLQPVTVTAQLVAALRAVQERDESGEEMYG